MPFASHIRFERADDHAAIGKLVKAAFFGKPYSDGDEAELVQKLRDHNALSVSLVAELDGKVVGHIGFSPAYPADGAPGWYALGPLAVHPSVQRNGIGSQLVRAGLQALIGLEASGCILVGDTRYYARFGFECAPSLAPSSEPAEFFMVKLLGGSLPQAPISFHRVFRSAS